MLIFSKLERQPSNHSAILSNSLSIFLVLLSLLFVSCKPTLHPVSVREFAVFVEATDYVTDAEQFGWSIVQLDIEKFEVLYGIDWRCPTGELAAQPDFAVTQVSLNDALAYAQWAGVTLPDYKQYWEIAARDERPINFFNTEILPIAETNIVGNVWELTLPKSSPAVRLAGGSYLCHPNTCNGTDRRRELWIDATTGNTHIGFAVLK